jgi:hypothetical protein
MDIVGLYKKAGIEIKQSGDRWKACCPFHVEDTPSFIVYPIDGSYHCFGCQAHGNIKKLLEGTGTDIPPKRLEDLSNFDNLSAIKNTHELNLEILLFDKPYDVLNRVWLEFDRIWIDLSFEEHLELVEKLLFVNKRYTRLVNSLKN